MIPFTATHNLRLVLLNMRDYPGSTLYTPAELAELRDAPHAALRARGNEVATFLAWYVAHARIPPIAATPEPEHAEGGEESGAGGLAVVAWSAGNCYAIPMIAHAGSLPHETRALLDRYLRSFVAFGTSPAPI